MKPSRTQRYRLTHEFVLRDRGDYALARACFEEATSCRKPSGDLSKSKGLPTLTQQQLATAPIKPRNY